MTTEIVRACLFFKNPTGLTIIDLVNIYRPPISSSPTECRSQNFNMDNILSAICQQNDETVDSCTSRAILLGGDLNVHSKLWDPHNREDKLGISVAASLTEYSFTVANNGERYYARPNVRTAPDVTCFHGDISVSNWNCDIPYGKCHHNIISYHVLMSYASLHCLSTSFPNAFYRTRPSLQNINYTQYNSHLEHALFTIFARDPLPTTAKTQVHFLANALTHAFQYASKTLPQGHHHEPTPWCPPKLERLLAERNHSWCRLFESESLDDSELWHSFYQTADAFRSEVIKVQ